MYMKIYIIIILLTISLVIPVSAFAEETPIPGAPLTPDISGRNCPSGQVCIANPLDGKYNSDYTPQKFIGNIIKALLGVIGSIALVMFVYGGFLWMTAAGEKAKVTKGADTMLWAVLGLTVIFSSYALVRFVIEKVGS